MGNQQSTAAALTRNGTKLSEVQDVFVKCALCKSFSGEEYTPGRIGVRCATCKQEAVEGRDDNNQTIDPYLSISWEWLDSSTHFSAFCHNCNSLQPGEVFGKCVGCHQPCALTDECSICWERYDLLTEMSTLDECGHRFCKGCWGQHCASKIKQLALVPHGTTGFYSIECPADGCTQSPGDPHFIKALVSPELYDRMKRYATQNFAQLSLGAVTCPRPECGSVMIPDSNRLVVQCIDCNEKFCRKCKAPEHRDQTCEAVQAAANEDQGLDAKPCPNPKCGMLISKDEGCNYVRCANCKHQFCWVCLKEWASDFNLFDKIPIPLHTFNINKPCSCPKW